MNTCSYTRQLFAAGLLVLLSACAAPPEKTEVVPVEAKAALTAQSKGDWEAAAGLWEQAAGNAPAGSEAAYRLNAADAWRLAGDSGRAHAVMRTVDTAQLSKPANGRYALINAELALGEGDADRAEFFLDAAATGIDITLRPRLSEAQRRLQQLRIDPSARALASASAGIRDMRVYDASEALAIIKALEGVPSSRLQEVTHSRSSLAQWAELALALRRDLVAGTDLLGAATSWESTHPGHRIDAAAYMELAWQYGLSFPVPARIAVLLPGDGNLSAAGTAIRDGLVSAYIDRPAQAELHFMVVGEDPVTALMAYSRAAELGYDWVIGPLRRESVAMIRTTESPALPALLLNQAESEDDGLEPAENLFTLSLSQQAEARSVAREILAKGHTSVILLVSDSPWGERAERAFMEEFLAAEGTIVATERFGTSTQDHSERLTRLLRIEASKQRKASLQAAIGIPLEFEATRRDDFDAIFMAADPTTGRQLKPQLRFYDAGDKPIYAMSRIFSGQINTIADQDLNGVVFASTRNTSRSWDERGLAGLESLRGGAFGALHELGTDAWNVLPWLRLLAKDPDLSFPGAVGELRLDAHGNLQREPVWMRFQRGRPVLLEAPAGP